jgi:hypothetical protein
VIHRDKKFRAILMALVETLTFALAIVAFAGLAVSVALVDWLHSAQRGLLNRMTALAVSADLLLVCDP